MRINILASGIALAVSSILPLKESFAAYEPAVTIECDFNLCLTTTPPGILQWAFPGTTVNFHATVTGNPYYLVDDPHMQGGGYVELYKAGTRVARTRINASNTGNVFYAELLWCPAALCGVDVYEPFYFGSPTEIDFQYTLPPGQEGIYEFNARFSGDDFTSASNSSVVNMMVSCEPRRGPGGQIIAYPPSNSGC